MCSRGDKAITWHHRSSALSPSFGAVRLVQADATIGNFFLFQPPSGQVYSLV